MNNIEENKTLIYKYPFLTPRCIRTNKIPEDYNYEYTLLDDIPVGWKKAFGEALCEDLKRVLEKNNKLHDYQILQIKEKYGELRLYDNYGTDDISAIVNKYTEISRHICVKCGAPCIKNTKYTVPLCDDCLLNCDN